MFSQVNIIYPIVVGVAILFVVFIIMQFIRYEKILKEKDLSIIQFYLDKKFLTNHLKKNFTEYSSLSYIPVFLENIKFYFKLDEIQLLSQKELEQDQELFALFRTELEDLYKSLISKNHQDIYRILNTSDDNSHRLYVYPGHNNILYIKAPYRFTNDEIETLDICAYLVKLFSSKT